jgi:type IV pilus assembly protein PilC
MPNYFYEAINGEGKKVKGYHRSGNKQTAIQELRAKNLLLREVKEKQPSILERDISFGPLVKPEHFVFFCRQFATLIRSGIEIETALSILIDQSPTKRLREALAEVADRIRNGHSLSKSFAEHPKIFPEMFVNMIAAAEISGGLEDTLLRLAVHYEKEHKTVKQIKSALVYPVIVTIVAIGVVIFLLLNVVPVFTNMFADQGAELPIVTKIVVGASDLVVQLWWIILLLPIILFIAFRMFINTDQGRYSVDLVKFRIPLFGAIFRKAAIARLTRTLSSLMTSAVPVLQALELTEKVVNNQVYVKVLRQARIALQQGKSLSQPLADSKQFPAIVTQMIQIGEETGQMDAMLEKVSESFENDVEQSVERLKSTIEPVMLLIVSALVGFIVIAVMTPMFTMYENFLS